MRPIVVIALAVSLVLTLTTLTLAVVSRSCSGPTQTRLDEDAAIREFIIDRYGPARGEVWVRRFCTHWGGVWDDEGNPVNLCDIDDFGFTMECEFVEWRSKQKLER